MSQDTIMGRRKMSFSKYTLTNKKIYGPLKTDKKDSKRTSFSGSFTLEAALILPMFSIFFVILFSLFEMLRIQCGVEMALHQKGNELALMRYEADMAIGIGSDVLANFDKDGKVQESMDKIPDTVKDAAGQVVTSAAATKMVGDYLEEHDIYKSPVLASDIIVVPTSVSETSGIIALEAFFETKPYFNLFFGGFSNTLIECRYFGHDWTGYDMNFKAEESDEPKEAFVYVCGKDAKHAYHKDPTCTYLLRNIKSCNVKNIDDKRNSSGARYYPCEVCGGGVSGKVYYTQYGTAYHSSVTCSELSRTIESIKESEAIEIGMRPCSKCSGSSTE